MFGYSLTMSDNIFVLIPAHNEQDSISGLIDEVVSHIPKSRVVVINDGSVDKTMERASTKKVDLINFPKRMGIGKVMSLGVKKFLKSKEELLVRIDGDGQHNPEDFEKLKKMMVDNLADIVVGSRYKKDVRVVGENYSILGEAFFFIVRKLVHKTSGVFLSDPTSGFMLMNRKAAKIILEMKNNYLEPEMYAYLSRRGCKLVEVDVSMRMRIAGTSFYRGISGYLYGLKIIRDLLLTMRRNR